MADARPTAVRVRTVELAQLHPVHNPGVAAEVRLRIAYTKSSYGGRWNIYSDSSRVGYVSPFAWQSLEHLRRPYRVGYVKGGTGGPAGGAALLLLVG